MADHSIQSQTLSYEMVALNPISAVTHRDPYPYYAELREKSPLQYSDELKMWVALSASTVAQVMMDENSRVRPLNEPVPQKLVGTATGDVFRHLVRMNDGPKHHAMKSALTDRMPSILQQVFARTSREWSARFASGLLHGDAGARASDMMFQFPATVIGSALGIAPARLDEVPDLVGSFVRCLTPGSTGEETIAGIVAAQDLSALVHDSLEADTIGRSVLSHLVARSKPAEGEIDREAMVANALGLLSQAYEATAGLIGNSLLCLARRPELRDEIARDRGILRAVVSETVRYDAPVQTTRRFIAADSRIADEEIRAGDCILVVLAAANRDPAVNPEPDRFDLERKNRKAFTFGLGAHMCPGEVIAMTITEHAVAALMTGGLEFDELKDGVTYRSSANVRIPVWNG